MIHSSGSRRPARPSRRPPRRRPPKSAIAEAEPPRVYILCERADRQTPEFVALRKHLISQGMETILPTVGESESETLELHREKLAECDGALIYFGAGAPRWFEVKLNDFRKLLRNRKAASASRRSISPNLRRSRKDEVETNEALVLRPDAGFAPESLAALPGQTETAGIIPPPNPAPDLCAFSGPSSV